METSSSNSSSSKPLLLDHHAGKRNVYKFGGTSVGSPQRLANLVKIVQQERERIVAVVVSAMGDTTDYLIEAVDFAAKGQSKQALEVVDNIEQICLQNAHETQKLIDSNLPKEPQDMSIEIKLFLKPLRELLFGVSLLQERTDAALDAVLSFGERISATIVAKLLTLGGIEAFFVDARDWIITDEHFGCARVFFEESKQNLQEMSKKWTNKLPVITGFIGRSKNGGRTTTLGRNGSDYTATLVGASLQADYIVINTDISGVMTADPRIVERAVALSHLNHHEALELAVYGTRMFHARTMVPLIHAGVTMFIRNTMDPNGHGTYISSLDYTGKEETCTTSLENLSIFEVRTRILQDNSLTGAKEENIGARITKLFETKRIPVWLSIRGAHGQAISVVIPRQLEQIAFKAIQEELSKELEDEEVDPIQVTSPVTMLSIVAEKMSKIPLQQSRFFSALAQASIDVLAVGQGTSTRSLSCVIHGKDTKIAVKRVHDAFNVDFLEANIILLGCNQITLQVLHQLQTQAKELYLKTHQVKFKVVGYGAKCQTFQLVQKKESFELDLLSQKLQNCKGIRAVFVKDSIDQEEYAGTPNEDQLNFLQELSNPILIDCSGHANRKDLYLACIERGIHVVVSNARSVTKLPDLQQFLGSKIRESRAITASSGRTSLMYSSTIGTSVPVVETLSNILRTGDKLFRIEASLSGSMGFVSNQMILEGKKLSEAVQDAWHRGFLEKDPREDLTGQDTASKILVLLRTLGVHYRLESIEIQPFIPSSVLETINWSNDMTVEDIIQGLEKYDVIFHEKWIAPAAKTNRRLRYVASISLLDEHHVVQVKIHPALVDESHPAYFTQADEIAIGFKTLQYSPQPLVLKGTGTGAPASATGVLRDVIKIVSILNGKTPY